MGTLRSDESSPEEKNLNKKSYENKLLGSQYTWLAKMSQRTSKESMSMKFKGNRFSHTHTHTHTHTRTSALPTWPAASHPSSLGTSGGKRPRAECARPPGGWPRSVLFICCFNLLSFFSVQGRGSSSAVLPSVRPSVCLCVCVLGRVGSGPRHPVDRAVGVLGAAGRCSAGKLL